MSDTKDKVQKLTKLRHDLAEAYLALCDFMNDEGDLGQNRSIPLDKQSLKLLNELKIQFATEVLND
ncbi:hypothetical protein [Bdellovibrio sp. HCB288]|uniref:hypothetical protein n=1 Tax=Bdellovibrio sp. HCB288 TaxID=3394355 RepID=UPI0039B3F497